MTKGTISREVQCAACESNILEVPDDMSDNSLVHCIKGHVLGTYGSIKLAMRGEAHSEVKTIFTGPTFKPWSKQA